MIASFFYHYGANRKEKSVNVTLGGKNHELTFAPYQVKTLLYTGDSLEESERLII